MNKENLQWTPNKEKFLNTRNKNKRSEDHKNHRDTFMIGSVEDHTTTDDITCPLNYCKRVSV